MADDRPHVLILGAGINGAALARELALNGASVTLVDSADLAFGATAYSSRLIHGGLRYLEYGEFALVRESLEERTRLLRLAPQFVRPVRLFIPVTNRFGGALMSLARFLRLGAWANRLTSYRTRGLWMVRIGLRLYDLYARDPDLPRHEVHRTGSGSGPPVDRKRFRWLCSYYDAQIVFPERFVVALLRDAAQAAAAQGASFELLNYCRATLRGGAVEVRPSAGGEAVRTLRPDAVVNATGAWVDLTLENLGVQSPQLMGGTKGSHLVAWNHDLRQSLGSDALYAEAADGRPVFVLPFVDDATLIGTTDERFAGDPADARASADEIAYLVDTVNRLLPGAKLTVDEVDMHYSGVRPLPFVPTGKTASITRRHAIHEHSGASLPMFSIVGGKLTTCRSLAEEAAKTVLGRIGRQSSPVTRDRPLPGAADYPQDPAKIGRAWQKLAASLGFEVEQVHSVWSLCGTLVEEALRESQDADKASLDGTRLPLAFARWSIRREHARTLEDLVERRLMLLYHPRLSLRALQQLAELLISEGCLEPGGRDTAVANACSRLERHFGKRVTMDAGSEGNTSN